MHLSVLMSHTFTVRSFEALVSTSFSVASARIHETWDSSECVFDIESRFHTLIDLSFEPEKSRLADRASARTRELWPRRVCLHRMVFRSHTLMSLSCEADSSCRSVTTSE